MTSVELKDFIEMETKIQNEIYQKAKDLFENECYTLSEYENINAYSSYWSAIYLKNIMIESNTLDDDLEYAMESLTEFKETIDNTKGIKTSGVALNSFTEEGYVYDIKYTYSYMIICDDEQFNRELSKIIREKISQILKPESEEDQLTVDCGMLTLFKDDKIDWKTLQKITYKECEI